MFAELPRLAWSQLSSIRTYAKAIVAEGKHFHFVQSHNLLDLLQGNRFSIRVGLLDKLIDAGPAIGIKFQPNLFGVMPECETQIFTYFGKAVVHVR